MRLSRIMIVAAALVLGLNAVASATRIQDLVRLKGAEENRIVGLGLVVGLKGTGDSGKYRPGVEMLAKSINKLANENTTALDLVETKNVAMVAVEAIIPAAGGREGDTIEVKVSSIGSAKSLVGGRLLTTTLIHPERPGMLMAYASGTVKITHADTPTTGVIANGALLTANVWSQLYDAQYQITLVINQEIASWPVAHAIARQINDEMAPDGPELAKVIDGKNVMVAVPMGKRDNPSMFINRILTSYIPPTMINTPARVVINETTGTIVITGDVRLSPVIIRHEGLVISTITPAPRPTAQNPEIKQDGFVLLDPDQRADPALRDLTEALNVLKVPAQDQIAIIKEIYRSGKLHAELLVD